MKIRKGDKVYVVSGADRGKTGIVSRVFMANSKAVVEGVNIVKKAVKKTKKNAPSGIVEKAAPIAVSNLAIFCPSCNKSVKIGYRVLKNGNKERICKKCNNALAKGIKDDKA